MAICPSSCQLCYVDISVIGACAYLSCTNTFFRITALICSSESEAFWPPFLSAVVSFFRMGSGIEIGGVPGIGLEERSKPTEIFHFYPAALLVWGTSQPDLVLK